MTESFELADTLPVRLYWMLAGPARRRGTNLNGMRVTLERIKAVTESADPSHEARVDALGRRCATLFHTAIHQRAHGGYLCLSDRVGRRRLG